MRKLALLLVAAGITSVASAQAAQRQAATIRLVDRAPLMVRGLEFRNGERVRIIVLAGSRSSQVVRASAQGTFVVRFNRSAGRCTRVSVQAFGSMGSRARLLPSRIAIDCVSNA
jgi:hypothetical protein